MVFMNELGGSVTVPMGTSSDQQRMSYAYEGGHLKLVLFSLMFYTVESAGIYVVGTLVVAPVQ